MIRACSLAFLLSLAAAYSVSAQAPAQPPLPADNIGHERHKQHHNPKHATEAPTPARFVTSRKSEIVLPLPEEKDAFTFVVYGDRTGGPVDGVKVLADVVRDTNLLEPDMVMTVGDLVNGYNDTPAWLEQAKEYKTIMSELRCPWFPVVGNHDVYWRGQGPKPEGEHEKNFEMNFGPLWYAFKHKNCWFIALHSDETNPKTGEKNFNKPENHVMSDEQFNWLKETLDKAKGADHVFLFLHHPRWTGGQYGDSWDRVHTLLKSAGNVTAVFAGHIHHMRYDPKDGIEYVTLASVGAHQDGVVPQAGWLHEFHVITVRKNQVAMAAIPVGDVMDVREITGELMAECAAQKEAMPVLDASIAFAADGAVDMPIRATLKNVTTRDIDITAMLDSGDSRWSLFPDHAHARLAAGATRTLDFRLVRRGGELDNTFRDVELVVNTDVLMPGHRYSMPEQRVLVPLNGATLPAVATAAGERALRLNGEDALLVDNSSFSLPDGPFTLECWMKADKYAARTGLLCKTEQSDYGIFVSSGIPEFSVFLGNAYVSVKPEETFRIDATKWHHVAGVYDGKEVRLYVDGAMIGAKPGAGKRKTNKFPLAIGADIDSSGKASSEFVGFIDSVRLTRRALYSGASFTPVRRPEADADTALLSNMDQMLGGSVRGEGAVARFGRAVGRPEIVPVER